MQIGIVLILNIYIGILLCQIKETARESLKDTNAFDKFMKVMLATAFFSVYILQIIFALRGNYATAIVMDLIACPILISRREFRKSRENFD